MDKNNAQVFTIIFGIPVVLSLFVGWIIMGNETIKGGWLENIFSLTSMMWIPTVLVVIVFAFLNYYLFHGYLLRIFKRNKNNICKWNQKK